MANTRKLGKIPKFAYVKVPIYSEKDGQLEANTLFHRSYDRLHSRCIEYPFAASRLGNSYKVLDVGTAKADKYWVEWLRSLVGREIFAIDFDNPRKRFSGIKFRRSDIRELKFRRDFFDLVYAVSVIEHIGLEDSQVIGKLRPKVQEDGDVRAVREISRVLKQGGRLVMTFPFGKREGLMRNGQARIYTQETIKKFGQFLKPITLDYYEYQSVNERKIVEEKTTAINFISSKLSYLMTTLSNRRNKPTPGMYEGDVVWRKVDINKAEASNQDHVDGVLCGVWQKSKILDYG